MPPAHCLLDAETGKRVVAVFYHARDIEESARELCSCMSSNLQHKLHAALDYVRYHLPSVTCQLVYNYYVVYTVGMYHDCSWV